MPLPDLIEIVPLDKPVRAEITVPGSKSITNRALILAALAEGEITLEGALWSEDTQIMTECLQELGFMVDLRPDPNEACNRTITVYGKGGAVPPGGTEQQPVELFVGNAGTAARFLAAFVCLGKGVYRLHGVPRMHERPQAALFKALRELGYRVESENENEKLPARIFAGSAERGSVSRSTSESQKADDGSNPVLADEDAAGHRPALRPQRSCTVSIEESSQFASALLLCSKTGGWQVEVVGENAEESPYVAMTLKLIEAFPKRGGKFQIEPDASSGSYFVGAEWLLEKYELIEVIKEQLANKEPRNFNPSKIHVRSWPTSKWQIDSAFARLANLTPETGHSPQTPDRLIELPPKISRMTDLGDSIMTSITLSPLLSSTQTEFTELMRLRVQETERVIALKTELTKCGAKVEEIGDTLIVRSSELGKLHGAEIETYNDHRMAMCFAILGLKVPGIKIKNPACVKKTFPNFFQKLAAPPPHGLGATILEARTGRRLTHEELFAD